MENRKLGFRMGLVITILAAVLTLFCVRLYRLQIVEGESYVRRSTTYVQEETVEAARGAIMDRYGKVLVSSRVEYNIGLNTYVLQTAGSMNETILALIRLAEENGVEYIDGLPVSAPPFEYTLEDATSQQRDYFSRFLDYKAWDSDMTAANLIKRMRTSYHIDDDVSDEDARRIIGVRYELELRYAVYIDPYIFATGIDSELLIPIKAAKLPGVEISQVTAREYHTTYAAHILGRVGLMGPDELESLKDQGYAMNAVIGKDGLEQAFEPYLRGVAGERSVTLSSEGKVVDESYITQPQPGGNVFLTIDIELQEVAERSLESCIQTLRNDETATDGRDAEGGAVVVMDVNNFDILACASYPTYDLSTFSRDFDRLNNDVAAPLYNRAIDASYAPGSTYKMVTSVAALDEGVIGQWTEIEDKGIYTYYDGDYQPACSFFTKTGQTHGFLNVMQALSVSCNYFYYEVGRLVGIEALDDYAESFGLGQPTGIELSENIGVRANPENRAALYDEEWYSGQTIAAAIGQSDNQFSPLQLCCYVATLANGGTRYQAHFLKSVSAGDFTATRYTFQPQTLGKAKMSQSAYQAVKDGLLLTSTEGTAVTTFGRYDIQVCSKTGTAQHGAIGSDNGAFVCFAPYDDPEIAVVVYVEKGGSGGSIATVAKDILDYYFSTSGDSVPFETEGELLK